MSDPNAPHDPIDKAYAEAEAMLRDDAERAARRARVLAAVAHADEAEVEPASTAMPPPRRSAWRPAPWLMAAGVAGVAVLVTVRMTPPTVVRPPQLPPEAETAAPATVTAPTPAQPIAPSSPAPPSPAPRSRAEAAADVAPPPPPSLERRAPRAEPFPAEAVPPPPLAIPPIQRRVEAPAPPPPPLPIPPVERRVEQPAPPVIVQALPAPAPASRDSRAAAGALNEIVVTGSSIRGVAPVTNGAIRLRASASAGRTDDLTALLATGVAVDEPDAAGETALMKAVQAGQSAAITLLRRNGADPDRRNRAGVSARDMATASANPAVQRAMDIAP